MMATESAPLIQTDLSADGQWSDILSAGSGVVISYTVTGVFGGKVTMQGATLWRDTQPVWITLAEFDAPAAGLSYPLVGDWIFRIGFQSGDYSGGTATARIYRGEDDDNRFLMTRARTVA